MGQIMNRPSVDDRDQVIRAFRLPRVEWPFRGQTVVRGIDHKDERYLAVKDFFESTKGDTDLEIVKIWTIDMIRRTTVFEEKGYNQMTRQWLWHGSKRDILSATLSGGPQRMSTEWRRGVWSGEGLHLSDGVVRSAAYTDQSGLELLLLCDVAVGDRYREVYDPGNSRGGDEFERMPVFLLDSAEKSYDSGSDEEPGESGLCALTKLVNGDEIDTLAAEYPYREYVIHDTERLLIEYIVQCRRHVPHRGPPPMRTLLRFFCLSIMSSGFAFCVYYFGQNQENEQK